MRKKVIIYTVWMVLAFLICLSDEAYAQPTDTSLALTDIKFVRLSIDVDPAKRFIKGRAQINFAVSDISLNRPTEIQLADDYIIKSINSHHKPLYYYRRNGHIRIYPVPEWSSLDSITIEYYGVPPSTGLGSVMFDRHESAPVFWTLSEPFGAMDWWPCKQDITDKIDSVAISVTCPEEYRAVSNGVLLSEHKKDGQRTAEWMHRYPIAYHLICVAVSNYRKYSDWLRNSTGDSVEMVNYVYPEKYDQWRRRTYKLQPAYKMMCDYFGDYPFAKEKYGQAQFGWSGGMEHQTMSFISNAGLDLMIHELAHQWFGNMVTCASWRDVFLHEGLATYCELLATEKGVAQSQDAVQWRRASIGRACRKPHGTLFVRGSLDVANVFDTDIVYNKGAMMLHTLRLEIGDQKFFACLRMLAEDAEGRYGNVSVSRFFDMVKSVCGRNMDWFFDQWFYGAGYPIYKIRWNQTSDGLVDVLISQDQSDKSVEFFRCKVPLMLHGENGEKTIFRLNNYYNNQHFTINPKFDVSSVELDPYGDLITAGSEVESVLGRNFRSVQVKNEQWGLKISLPDSSRYNWYIMRSMSNSKVSYRDRIGDSRRLDIHTSEMEEGKYILILEGKDYYSTIVNVWKRRKKDK